MDRAASGTTFLTGPPNLGALYARSLLHRTSAPVDFPRTTVTLQGAGFDAGRLAGFARLTGFPLRDELPLPFPHLLGFALQVQLLVTEPFPFRLLGLVHLRQRFEQTRPLRLEDRVDVSVRAVGLRPHRRGTTVDLVTQVRPAGSGEVVWSGWSRYLARGLTMPGTVGPSPVRLAAPEGPGTLWRVPADTGRLYAAVSGDVNPIHLAAPAAKLLGFRRALAHGLWTASRSLAALGGRLPDAARFDVEFGTPLLLPSTVRHVTAPDADGWSTAVRSRDGERVHLVGRLEPVARQAGAAR